MRSPSRRTGFDRPGESSLQRFDWLTFVKAVPGIAAKLGVTVPPDRVSFRDDVAVVTCVCDGGWPFHVEPAKSALCKCGRVFVNIGGEEVRVARTEEAA